MICERCHKKEATVHLTEIIKAVRSEVHLCDSCARDVGFNSKSRDAVPLSDYTRQTVIDDAHVCPGCASDIVDITESARAGCPRCYAAFEIFFLNILTEIPYAGRVPANYSEFDDMSIAGNITAEPETVEILKRRLEDAVHEERYEEAARIRDIIREREGSFSV